MLSLTNELEMNNIHKYKENSKNFKEWVILDLMKKSLEMHEHFGGKMEIRAKVPVQDKYDLSLAYSPGVAAPCLEIEKIHQRYMTIQ